MPISWRRLPWELRYRWGATLASASRPLLVQATHRHCRVEFQGPVLIGPGFELVIPDRGTLVVGPGVQFRRGFYCEIAGDGVVMIGTDSVFTSTAMIQCSTSITIGQRCVFGQATLVADGNHRFRDWAKPLLAQGYDFRPITVEDDATITSKCTIVNDVGHHAFVGANSVVTRAIPPYCLAAGVPAPVIEYFGPPDHRPADSDG